MTRTEIVARARGCIGHHVPYVLGKGNTDPHAPFPWPAPESGCDCSGLATWALGLARQIDGLWYGTDQIVADATGAGKVFHAVAMDQALPGDLVVYPHQKPGHHGHVGVITEVEKDRPSRVVHCSMGNWRLSGDSVQETAAGLWTVMVSGSIVARAKFLNEPPAA